MSVRAFALCIGLAAAVTAVPALSAPGKKEIKAASREASKGDRALQSGDLPHAKEFYSAAIQRAPGFPGALIGLGQVALAESDFSGALDYFQQAKTAFVAYGEAMLDLQSRRYADAQKEINGLQDSMQQLQSATNVQQDASIRISRLPRTGISQAAVDRSALGRRGRRAAGRARFLHRQRAVPAEAARRGGGGMGGLPREAVRLRPGPQQPRTGLRPDGPDRRGAGQPGPGRATGIPREPAD